MRMAKRITTACLTAIMIFQALAPSTEVFAQEVDAMTDASIAAAQSANNLARGVKDAVSDALSSDNADESSSDKDNSSKEDADEGSQESNSGTTDENGEDTQQPSEDNSSDSSTDNANDDQTADADDQADENADVDTVAAAAASYKINSIDELKTVIGESNVKTSGSGTTDSVTSITIGTNRDLRIVSNTNPSIYQNAEISLTGLTGDGLDMSVEDDSVKDYPFLGFGNDDHPFEGFLNLGNKTLTINKTLFNNLKLTDKNKDVSVIWKGASCQPIVAQNVNGNKQTMTANITVEGAKLNSPVVGTVTGNVTLNANYKAKSGNITAVDINSNSDNIGLLANTVNEGVMFTVGDITFNGGGFGNFAGLTPTIKTTADGKSAGGLIGATGDGATVELNKALDLSSFTVIGKAASGGLIGTATKLNLNQADGAVFTAPKTVGDAGSAASGGFIGSVSFAGEISIELAKQFSSGDGVTLSGGNNMGAGVVFGSLDLSTANVSINGDGETLKGTTGNGATSFAGVAGRVNGKGTGDYKTNGSPETLTIGKTKIELTLSSSSRPNFAAGIVGWLGPSKRATVCATDISVRFKGQSGTTWGAGGIAGRVDSGSVLDINNLTVASDSVINKGAGVVAQSRGAIVQLQGETNLTNLRLNASDSATGQIAAVTGVNPSLIYAKGSGSDDGWKFERSPVAELDDLAGVDGDSTGYGEVIRLDGTHLAKDLITFDSNHNVNHQDGMGQTGWSWQLGNNKNFTEDKNRTFSLGDVNDFAKLAITVQTHGLWNGVYGLNPNAWSQLFGSDIVLNITGDIDLSGTGFLGLTQDRNDSASFAGTLNGQGHTIKLAIGEPYGMRDGKALDASDTSEGNGKIYRHTALGLFCADGGSTVSNLTIAGFIKAKCNVAMDVASYASQKNGGGSTFTGCTFNTIADLVQNKTSSNFGYVYGRVTGGNKVEFTSNDMIQSGMTSTGSMDGNGTVAGAIGRIEGSAVPTINVDDLTIKGSMNVRADRDTAGVGGFIAVIKNANNQNNSKTVTINRMNLSNLSIEVKDVKKSAGGFLGYSWANTNVTYTGASASAPAVQLAGASLTISNSTDSSSFAQGGLVYKASGKWSVGESAINFENATIAYSGVSKTNMGLLVYQGGNVDLNGSLYLENTAPWNSAYKVDGLNLPDSSKYDHFDEWVCDTRAKDKTIDDCGVNGVISLHTSDETLHMKSGDGGRNSYVNRTSVGENKPVNEWARYFYNLDRASESAKVTENRQIDSPEELLLWCAYKYADSNGIPINSYFAKGDPASTNVIGGAAGNKIDIDMNGYSYYPVDISDADVNIRNANITFCYSDIKEIENGNKPNNKQTQHANMHAALLRNFTCGTTNSHVISVNNVTLAGSVGIDVNAAGHSGVIMNGAMAGSNSGGVARTQTLSIDGLELNNLTVDGVAETTESAPLIANSVGTYSTLNVNELSMTGYEAKTAAATSLFGSLGAAGADQVNATFSKIKVEGNKDKAVLTKASLLGSYAYKAGGSSSATYIFTKQDDANKKVTYGKEIDSVGGEYEELQRWYYDKDLYGNDDTGLVEDAVNSVKANPEGNAFEGYLPYVAKGYIEKDGYHEIKVNQRVSELVTGCGTYGDPYVISNADELNTLANYINTGKPATDWTVTIIKDQNRICERRSASESTDNEVTYQFKAGTWAEVNKNDDGSYSVVDKGKTLSNDTVRAYMQSCYISIEPVDEDGEAVSTLTIDGSQFNGLGTVDRPFRGVVVGNLDGGNRKDKSNTIKIQNATELNKGFIPYSYGSVIKDLNIQYCDSKAKSVAHEAKDESTGVPNAFWGGVIGCIMGGDNIIDGVAVSAGGSHFEVSGVGKADAGKLVQIGGYVGSIAGGGVIFRDMNEKANWRAATMDDGKLYDNPFVGRVIDGFAFSEGCNVDNGNDNYKINKLENASTRCVETGNIVNKYKTLSDNNEAITTTVKNAQGLLVLSAIINSGAGGGSVYNASANVNEKKSFGDLVGSKAYAGRDSDQSNESYRFGNDNLGKVRNANYKFIGNVSTGAEATDDFTKSKNDDQKAPGRQNTSSGGALDPFGAGGRGDSDSDVNSPYLVKQYATWQTGYVCAAKAAGMDLQFESSETSIYDMTGYGTGFVGLSGRYYSNACASNYGATRDRIVPLVACINGNGVKLILKSDVEQYYDDDYLLQSWGGLFSAITYTNDHVSASLSKNGGYVVKDLQFGDDSKESSVSLDNGDGDTGVGCLAGVTANANGLSSSGKYGNVKIVNCKISSPSMAGSLLGSSGMASRATDSNVAQMYNPKSQNAQPSPMRLYNCSYQSAMVKGKARIGGFVGAAGNSSPIEIRETAEIVLGRDSIIQTMDGSCVAGGVVGLASSTVTVNQPIDTNDACVYTEARLDNVKIKNNYATDGGIGGIVGNPKGGCAVSKVRIEATNKTEGDDSVDIGTSETVSKFKRVGGIAGCIDARNTYTFDSIKINHIVLSANDSVGGIVGALNNDVSISCDSIDLEGCSIGGEWSGGIVGAIQTGGSTIKLSNSVVRRADFIKANNGAVSGDGRGSIELSNVLFDQNAYYQAGVGGQGLLIGNADVSGTPSSSPFKGLKVAGIDIVPAKKAGTSENAELPDVIRTTGNIKEVNKKSYIAFGDYEDTLKKPDDGATLYSDDMASTKAASPYVTTSPTSGIAIKSGAATDTTTKYLFGDGANVGVAEKIQDEAGTTVDGRYTYTNIGGINEAGEYQKPKDGLSSGMVGTYNANNSDSNNQVDAKKDFRVLVVPGSDTTTVEKYLNVVTNGGYSDAKRLNPESKNGSTHVSATVKTVKLNADKSFEISKNDPALTIENKGTKTMTFRASGSDWDNEKGQFTLLTVTFMEAGQTYKVFVPIIVKRMLEVDFTATYSEGTNFNKVDYLAGKDASGNVTDPKFNNHVLISSGEAMTGYLTWTYGQKMGTAAEYGWKTYLESGGSAKALQKSIAFDGDALPAGTQLTLVDVAHDNKEYHYTVPEGQTASSVRLTDFVDSNNPGNNYVEKWLSEEIGVTAVENVDGSWVQQLTAEGATVKVDGKYYRLRTADDKAETSTFCNLTFAEEKPVSESFYLVVRTPKDSTSVNGSTKASFGETGVNTHINYMCADGTFDGHQSTPSTYSIASNYKHTLVDHKSGTNAMRQSGATYPLDIDVSDEIKFGEQEYTDNDQLFYQIDSSLVDYAVSGTSASSSGAHGYPTGTVGTYSFYVKVGGHYYTTSQEGSKWVWTQAGTEPVAAVSSASWTAAANDMSLQLASVSESEGKTVITPIDLSGIRKEAIKAAGKGAAEYSFTIFLKADLTMTEPACQTGIVAAQKDEKGNINGYTKPNYRAYLSTSSESMSASTNSTYNEGNAGYYREDVGSATISLEASDKTQLGINIDDLNSADGEIALVGTYDFSKATGGEAKIDAGNTVTYTLGLQQRQDDGTYESVNINTYLKVLGSDYLGTGSPSGQSIVFTDTKGEKGFATRDGSSLAFKHAFRVKVNTDVEKNGWTYANYRLVLTARLSGSNVGDTTPVNPDGYAGYPNSDYVTYTLARINTRGIDAQE